VSAKPELAAPTPAAPISGTGRPDKYIHPDGKQVPGTTTIGGRFADKSALIAWSHKQGLAAGILYHAENPRSHITLQDVEAGKELCASIARRTLTEARDQAADAGHVVHQWIQDDVHGRPLTEHQFVSDEIIEKARAAFAAFKEWAARVGLRIIATEIPLVHSALRYGGTLDAIGMVDGELSLLDWKSGNRCYPEHLIQQAAYRELLRDAREQLGDRALPVPESATLVRLDKETGKPHARSFGADSLDIGWHFFERALQMYRLDQSLTKLVAEPKEPKAKKSGKAA
jgi:hypothetical protein